jgi:hypothetical protein
MDARANIKSDLPGRDAPATARQSAIEFDRFDVVEIFKKTPSGADSKQAGRDVAKDIIETAAIPFLVKARLYSRLEVTLTDAELAERCKSFKSRESRFGSGAIREHAQQVGPAVNGAIPHRGGAQEKQCYADI